MKRLYAMVCGVAMAVCLTACDGDVTGARDDEWGMEGSLEPTPAPGKDDSEYRRGLLVNTDTSRTQVWTARNKWEDRDTVAGRKAGVAWAENSGLNWDEKYAAWLDSFGWVGQTSGYGETFVLTTPWGKTLPSPSLECAEMSLFLRITFAAWYELPLFWEAVDQTGTRIYFGHNGVRTQAGRYAQTPEFAIKFKDHTAAGASPWPSDTVLRTRKLWGGEDTQPMIADGAVFGAYVDEIQLNKRAGHFTVLALNYLSSINIADSANTYNIVPEAVRPGDTLIERWQQNGIGHTLVVKHVETLGEGSLDVTMVSGSMPRRQGKRESGIAAKGYFTSDYTGGEGETSDGVAYARMGGGLKRWRVTKNVDGYWTNTWMAADEAHWINSTDYPRIAARPGRFETLLGQVSPEAQREQLLAQIEDARRHLRNYPASCSARERRENAFEALYRVGARSFGQTQASIDAAHRTLEDYVLAELDYTTSKTCCWNSSNAAMYGVIMDLATAEQAADGEACVAPTVFMNQADGYARWSAHAETLGQGAAWRPWSEDEECAQRDVARDTEATHEGTGWCALAEIEPPAVCTDAAEPNDARAAAAPVVGSINDLQVCAGNADWFEIEAGGTVRITFRHADGDLDMEAFDANGTEVDSSAGTGDSEEVTVPVGGTVHVFGYNGAAASYTLIAP